MKVHKIVQRACVHAMLLGRFRLRWRHLATMVLLSVSIVTLFLQMKYVYVRAYRTNRKNEADDVTSRHVAGRMWYHQVNSGRSASVTSSMDDLAICQEPRYTAGKVTLNIL
jgi:hypothetical protein